MYASAWTVDPVKNGVEKRVPLATDKLAAQTMLNELVKKAERRASGVEDVFEVHRKRKLLEHLEDFASHLTSRARPTNTSV